MSPYPDPNDDYEMADSYYHHIEEYLKPLKLSKRIRLLIAMDLIHDTLLEDYKDKKEVDIDKVLNEFKPFVQETQQVIEEINDKMTLVGRPEEEEKK